LIDARPACWFWLGVAGGRPVCLCVRLCLCQSPAAAACLVSVRSVFLALGDMDSINDNTLAIITCREVRGKGDHARNIRRQVAGLKVARVPKSECNGSTGPNRITVRRSVTVVQRLFSVVHGREKRTLSQQKQQKWL
jgi:hypothetical protein